MTIAVIMVIVGALHAPVFAIIYRMAREEGHAPE